MTYDQTQSLTEIFVHGLRDDGYDLVPGRDVTNAPIGSVHWDDQGQGARGLVVRIGDEEEYPADIPELCRWLTERGYELDEDSLAAIAALGQ